MNRSKAARQKDSEETSNVQCYLLQNISFHGPVDTPKPYASVSILDPIITIERHHRKYHIAARFNIETTILNYESQTRDGHEYFFQYICLQYLNSWDDEEMTMRPESDPLAALTVTRGTETSISGNAGVSLSQTPSANVSLGLTRTRSLTVEYALGTWSLSAHRITHVPPSEKESAAVSEQGECPTYQWFWAGTHGQTKTLTPDLKYTVKRHVVVKRTILVADLQFPKQKKGDNKANGTNPNDKDIDDAGEDDEDITTSLATEKAANSVNGAKGSDESETTASESLEKLLDFSFRVQVRVKKRFCRFHWVMMLSGNEIKGKLMQPPCEQNFRLRAKPKWEGVPKHDTPDINALLGQIKDEYAGRYDDLEEKDFFELSNAYVVKQERNVFQTREMYAPTRTRYETTRG